MYIYIYICVGWYYLDLTHQSPSHMSEVEDISHDSAVSLGKLSGGQKIYSAFSCFQTHYYRKIVAFIIMHKINWKLQC